MLIGNSSNKEGEFSLIKMDVTMIHLFPYVKDKVTIASTFTFGEEFPKDLLTTTDWADFTNPIMGTPVPNFFITYFGQQLAYGDLSNDDVTTKLVHLSFGYELWANTDKDAIEKLEDILTNIEEIKTHEKIKKYFNPTWDASKSLPLATSNVPLVP
jgi:hypothetical protein